MYDIKFTSFEIEDNRDFLHFGGVGQTQTTCTGNQCNNTQITSENGLSFMFTSDNFGQLNGFEVTITCDIGKLQFCINILTVCCNF